MTNRLKSAIAVAALAFFTPMAAQTDICGEDGLTYATHGPDGAPLPLSVQRLIAHAKRFDAENKTDFAGCALLMLQRRLNPGAEEQAPIEHDEELGPILRNRPDADAIIENYLNELEAQ